MNVLFRLRYNNVKTFYNETRGYVTLNPCMIKTQIRGFLLKKIINQQNVLSCGLNHSGSLLSFKKIIII